MSRVELIRAGAAAAVIGGLLRVASSFAPGAGSEAGRQFLYLAVDVFLLLGVLSFYALRHEAIGWTGALGFLLALIGLLVVRSSRAVPGLDLYPAGALTFATGLIVMCTRAWRAHVLAAWVPAAFTLSTLVGLLGAIDGNAGWLLVVAGVLFGLAFAGLGIEVWAAERR